MGTEMVPEGDDGKGIGYTNSNCKATKMKNTLIFTTLETRYLLKRDIYEVLGIVSCYNKSEAIS